MRAGPGWWLPPTLLLLAVALLGAAWASGARAVFEGVLHGWIVHYDAPPFADAAGVAGMAECERLGHETYLANPCDPKARPFVYTPAWKLLSAFPVTRAWTLPLVLSWIALFFAALYALPRAPGTRGAVAMAAAMLSPATIMVIDYGNNEMLIFALATAAALLLGRSWAARRIAYVLIGLAAVLKYFPALAFAAALRERTTRLFAIAALAIVAMLAFVWLAGSQLGLALGALGMMSPLSMVFGLPNVSEVLLKQGASTELALAARIALTVLVIAGGLLLSRHTGLRAAVAELAAPQRDCLLVGGLLLLAAYLAGQNVDYRQIYTIMILPALCALRGPGLPPRFAALPWLAVALMWEFPLRYHTRALFEFDSPAHSFVTSIGVVLREAGWIAYAIALVALVVAAIGPIPVLDRSVSRAAPGDGGG